jgi:hypothetical protein
VRAPADLPPLPTLVRAEDGGYTTADLRWWLRPVGDAWEVWDTAPAPPILVPGADPSPTRVAYRCTLADALVALALFSTARPLDSDGDDR